jgi:hypothetical protein
VDELLWGLSDDYYYIVGYANDFAILMNGKFPHCVRGVTKIIQLRGVVRLCCKEFWA